jgi:hypothetical protein
MSTSGLLRAVYLTLAFALLGCGSGGKSTPPPVCDSGCQDGIALRALRTLLKLAYNFTVQGKPVGAQNATIPCVYSGGVMGSVHVFGLATANADQGTTFVGDASATPPVPLTYDFKGCRWIQQDPEPGQNFDITLSGSVGELGTLAQQPSATTALAITGSDLHLSGTVYDPALAYDQFWDLSAGQDGNNVGACLCAPAGDAGTSAVDGGPMCGVDAGSDCRLAAFSFN